MQDRSCQDKAIRVTKSRVLGYAANFSIAQWVGLEVGQCFVNPLHQLHKGGREVTFIPSQAVFAPLQHIADSF